MPNGDSLEIRHTPATIPGGARPGWGLPFERLPVGRVTPESTLEQEMQAGRQRIQDKYALQWKTVSGSRQFIGATKTSRMLREIDTKAKQEMLQFNQQMQAQINQLRDIDRLAQQGAIADPEQIKARMTFGPDVARSMYPTPKKEPSIPQQFGELDVYSHRISQELELFQPPKRPSKLGVGLAAISPLASIILAARKGKNVLKVWDFNLGDWRKANSEEVTRYVALVQEEKAIVQRKTELLGRPDISRRVIQPGTKGGTFSDKIAESVRPQRAPTVAKPKVRDPLGLR